MRSTFTKIFLAFWLTEILIFLCTFFILTNQFRSSEAVYTSAFAMMISNARQSVAAYESGGCDALAKVPNVFPLEEMRTGDAPALLFDPSGKLLCPQIGEVDPATLTQSLAKVHKDGFLLADRNGPGYIQGILFTGANKQQYIYMMRGAYPKEVYIPYREMAPRLLIALIVSILVTSGITMVITRPIGSLRAAARELASGNLRARVKWPSRKPPPKSSDELWGLVNDFNHMADRLESLVDAQMLLMRDVSHELRSPLARLSVALELAREEAQPEMEVQLERIERETGRLNSLISQLLSLSHLESTRKLPEGENVNLSSLVRELLPDMEYEAQRRNCSVRFSGDESCAVRGSRELLGRAIENVIRNAIAYTSEGTAVEIQLRCEDRFSGEFGVLQVRDHGPGVPEEGLKSIFRPFYRMDLSRQRSTGGYGVGLAITERAIRLHGGFVLARNSPEGGLIVEMSLPLVEATGPRLQMSHRSTA
jgi:two-component system sensor histidine kinase CpxA